MEVLLHDFKFTIAAEELHRIATKTTSLFFMLSMPSGRSDDDLQSWNNSLGQSWKSMRVIGLKIKNM